MFVLVATKPLNDGTKGFRFNVLGVKGLYRKRNQKSRGWFKYEPLATAITLSSTLVGSWSLVYLLCSFRADATDFVYHKSP